MDHNAPRRPWCSDLGSRQPAAAACQHPFPGGAAVLRIPSRKPGQACQLQSLNASGWCLNSHSAVALGHFLLIFILHRVKREVAPLKQLNNSAAHREHMVILPPAFHNLPDKEMLDVKINLSFRSDSLKQRVIVQGCWKQKLTAFVLKTLCTEAEPQVSMRHQMWSGYFKPLLFLGRSPLAFTSFSTSILYPTSPLQAFFHLQNVLQGAKLSPVKYISHSRLSEHNRFPHPQILYYTPQNEIRRLPSISS